MNIFINKVVAAGVLGVSLFSVSAMAINQDFAGIGSVTEWHAGAC